VGEERVNEMSRDWIICRTGAPKSQEIGIGIEEINQLILYQ
jgi:hypothetical protein